MNNALNAAGTAALNALLGAVPGQDGYGAAQGQKRSWEEAADGAGAKAARGRGWNCQKCGSHNGDSTQTCEVSYCQAPRPMQPGEWVCTCGNVNYATRNACGLRKCQLPRPADPQIEQIISSVMGPAGQFTGGPLPNSIAPGGGGRMGQAAPPEGSWRCLGCGNVNWPKRDTCNGRACGRPRAEVDGGPVAPPAPQQQYGMMCRQQQPMPEGSWSCLACGNINWPTRDTCNKRTCGRPRAEVDGGAPPAPQPVVYQPQPVVMQATAPEGSWVCVACNNVNWPTRDSCNRRSCGRQRAEVDGGPPTA